MNYLQSQLAELSEEYHKTAAVTEEERRVLKSQIQQLRYQLADTEEMIQHNNNL